MEPNGSRFRHEALLYEGADGFVGPVSGFVREGLHGGQVADFVLVADELACNSVQHGGGDGRLCLWAYEGYAVCEVSDEGLIVDALAGGRHPDLRGPGPGAGLWSGNQICDLLLIRSAPAAGTAVRGYLDVR